MLLDRQRIDEAKRFDLRAQCLRFGVGRLDAVTIDNVKGEVNVDFAGTSGKSKAGVNVVLIYTHAYTTFAIRSCLNPDLPNNFGSLAPIKVSAPPGCILNAQYPSPVSARHVVGMYVPMPILKALYNVVPDRVLAECAGAVWSVMMESRCDYRNSW